MSQITVPENIKALIFDLDGTLADTMPVHYKACEIVCAKYGFEFPIDLFYQMAGVPTIEVFRILIERLGLDLDYKQIGQEKEEAFLQLIGEIKPIDLVYQIALDNKGIRPMAIGSGGQPQSVTDTLEAIGMSTFFDAIVNCADVKNVKPAPDTFLLAAEKMNVKPEDCLVFEDGDPGILAAKAAGMAVVDVRPFLNIPVYK